MYQRLKQEPPPPPLKSAPGFIYKGEYYESENEFELAMVRAFM